MNTIIHCLARRARSEKCVIRQFRRCGNIVKRTYTDLDGIAYYTPGLYGTAYCSEATTYIAKQ